jgi:hypothetical protein
MHFLLCIHKVADFTAWHRIFVSHASAHQEAGLHLLHLLRDTADPNLVVLLFRTDDLTKARAFTSAPEAAEAGRASGVVGAVELLFLTAE